MKKLDQYIDSQKSVTPSPYLKNRIMAEIENLNHEPVAIRVAPLWQSLVVAASLVLVLALGVTIGSSYQQNTQDNTANLLVNDTYIEQLPIYTEYE